MKDKRVHKITYAHDPETGLMDLTIYQDEKLIVTETITDPKKVETILALLDDSKEGK